MNIVLVHCHFERGGVTQVVENHVRGLTDSDQVDQIILVSGGRNGGLSDQTLRSATEIKIPSLDYDSLQSIGKMDPDSNQNRAATIAKDLLDHLTAAGVAADNSIVHWHNHSLGKNNTAPLVIGRLAELGWRLVLQVHDFAEDNRPQNYAGIIAASGATTKSEADAFLYPSSAQIHYAALTGADADVFCQLGFDASQVHCLPNSVRPASSQPINQAEAQRAVRDAFGLPADARWVLYPVRGIRRKNLGEFLLLSRWLSEGTFCAITLCPTTPVEKASYTRWRDLAKTCATNAIFDAGHHDEISFGQNMAAAEFVMSTSVAEGFGMVFLEPWLTGLQVVARDLPAVTRDFQDAGMQLPTLYDRIPIPGDSTWVQSCLAEIAAAQQKAQAGLPEAFRTPIKEATNPETVDFAKLTPSRQTEALRRMAGDSGFDRETRQLSATLVDTLKTPADSDVIEHNNQCVQSNFSTEKQAADLLNVYQSAQQSNIDTNVRGPSSDVRAADFIAAMRPFYPCRTEEIV